MLNRRSVAVEDYVAVRNVIISVSDKAGLEELVHGLREIRPDVTIYSTGGTYRRIREILAADSSDSSDSRRSGRSWETPGSETPGLVEIAAYTGQPEMEGGLVKSLDFHVHAGILAEPGNEAHREYLRRIGAVYFDLVVVNLYPFEATISREDSDLEEARENIDIGGPTMLRAAAKNFLRVAAVTNPNRYAPLIDELRRNRGTLSLETRLSLARESFAHTRSYEAAISGYLESLDLPAVAKGLLRSEP